MKHKVGDLVHIKDNLHPTGDYGDVGFVSNMIPFLGQNSIIIDVDDSDEFGSYSLDIDKGKWSWTDQMLENGTVTNWRERL